MEWIGCISIVFPSDIVIINGRVVRAFMNCQLRAKFSIARTRSTSSPAIATVQGRRPF
jgi:hypothetical protein